MIPPFDASGQLSQESIGHGGRSSPTRIHTAAQAARGPLSEVLRLLKTAGCQTMRLDGSFVTVARERRSGAPAVRRAAEQDDNIALVRSPPSTRCFCLPARLRR